MNAQDRLFSAPQTAVTNDDWYTPKWIFDTLDIEFDLDVSAPPGGVPWIPTTRYFTLADDGLLQPWEGRVWMNPPFSKTTPWVEKFMNHRCGVALLPMGKNKHSETLWNSDAYYVYLPSNLKFMKQGKQLSIMFAAMLVTFEDELVENLARIGKVR
jgi:hypothetical protein